MNNWKKVILMYNQNYSTVADGDIHQLQSIRCEFCENYIYNSTNDDRVLQWSVFFNQLL
jgi:hypothetical protein